MKHFPDTEDALVVRTYFTDDAAWEALCTTILEPVGAFRAYVRFVNDPQYDGTTTEHLVPMCLTVRPIPSCSSSIIRHSRFLIIRFLLWTFTRSGAVPFELFHPKCGASTTIVRLRTWTLQNLQMPSIPMESFGAFRRGRGRGGCAYYCCGGYAYGGNSPISAQEILSTRRPFIVRGFTYVAGRVKDPSPDPA